jgi:cytochrome c-type biogenesis protein CcmH
MQASLIDALMFSLMVGGAVMAVLWPLSRVRMVPVAGQLDIDFYRQRLAEIDEDLARGLIRDSEAEAARTEAARRILAIRPEAPAGSDQPVSHRGQAALLALIGIPLVSLGLYGIWGNPDQPDMPFADRASVSAVSNASGMAGVISKIETHLATHPDDMQGWELIAPIYMATGQFDEAVKAYSALLRGTPPAASRFEALGEALVAQADGVVTAEAVALFAKALALDGNARSARFYSALALEQDGRTEAAALAFRALLSELEPGSEAAQTVQQRLDGLEKGRAR